LEDILDYFVQDISKLKSIYSNKINYYDTKSWV